MAQERKTTGRQPFKNRGERKPKFIPRRKVCAFCVNKDQVIDYKDPVKLRRFISDNGKIERRHRTGTCARHQRTLALAIKRARFIALLPHTVAHIRKAAGIVAQ